MSMIICKECGKEISDKANACPYCGCPVQDVSITRKDKDSTKKKESALSVWAGVLSLFGCTCFVSLILALVDLTKNDKSKKHTGSWVAIVMCCLYFFVAVFMLGGNEEDTSNQTVNFQTQDNTESSAADEKEENYNNIVEKGNSFESNGLKVTLNDANTDFTDYDDEYGVYKPEDGYKYISASFTFENTGDSDRYVSIYDFDCYADGTLCEQSYNFGGDFINANISSGRNVSFDTYYVVPVESNSIELEYTSNIWTDEKVIIKIK